MLNKEETVSLLQKLKLHGMANLYESSIKLAINQQPTSHELIAQMAHAEENYRTEKRTRTYLRMSKLRYDCVLQHVYCNQERNLQKEQIVALSDCSFIMQAQNILITGATGCGKSYLACALGRQACTTGYRVLYFGMARFTERIIQAKLDGTFMKFIDQLNKIHLLIIDDFGLIPIDSKVRLALLQILEDRYQNKAIIIASQLETNKWYDYLKDNTLADAIMDRLSASANIIELEGDSLRRKKIN